MHGGRAEFDAGPVAALEHLTGPSEGTATWLGAREFNVTLNRASRILNVSTEAPSDDADELVAYLRRSNGEFEVEAAQGRQIWINGRPVQLRRLEHRDIIEFSDAGPISRVFLYRSGQSQRAGVADILSDAAAYLRSSRRPWGWRLAHVTTQIVRRLVRETTILFRIGVSVAIVALGIVVYQQSRINALLQQQIDSGSAQREGIARLLAKLRKESLSSADLAKLRSELSGPMRSATERISELEKRSTAIARVIAQARSSILFLQGAYAFREKATGRMLRHAVAGDGRLLALPNGLPLLTLEGEGPVAERRFTGTGFVVGEDNLIATSGHIGQPWLQELNLIALNGAKLEPAFRRFIAYIPNVADAKDVALVRTSKVADLAILKLTEPVPGMRALRLAKGPPQPGEEVVLIGYPTGIRSMLAQAGSDFIEKLQQDRETDFWKVAAQLAAAGRIVPLASSGIVGRVSPESIVYDAETTHGGSGGPVLDINGAVVAVNSAILPEYGGSNLGVPFGELRRLIAEVQ